MTQPRAQGHPRSSGYARAEHDWYVEPPWIVDALFAEQAFPGTIWDPCCGRGTVPIVARRRGLPAMGTDLIDRGFRGATQLDFFAMDHKTDASIVSNPPFRDLQRFVDHALAIGNGHVAVLARLNFIETQGRREWFTQTRLSRLLVSSARVNCPPGVIAPPIDAEKWETGTAMAYAWFVWLPDHEGAPTLSILPPPGDTT